MSYLSQFLPTPKWKIEKFTTSGTWALRPGVAQVRVVAAGGGQGGGSAQAHTNAGTAGISGAGGAGGDVVDRTVSVSSDLTITIGGGGAGAPAVTAQTISSTKGSNGGDTAVTGTGVSITAYGGGRKHLAGSAVSGSPSRGGGGGGAGGPPATPDSALIGFSVGEQPEGVGGNFGGAANGVAPSQGGPGRYGMGGGGAGGATGTNTPYKANDGGGEGAAANVSGEAGVNATANTGGGGGGACCNNGTQATGFAGGNGASGCVYIIWSE